MQPHPAGVGAPIQPVDGISATAPLILRFRARRHALATGSVLIGAPVTLVLSLLVVSTAFSGGLDWDHARDFGALTVLAASIGAGQTALATRQAIRLGPFFAADSAGVWLAPQQRRRRVGRTRDELSPWLFVPWEEVARITAWRFVWIPTVRIKVRDPRLSPGAPPIPADIHPDARPALFDHGVPVPTTFSCGAIQTGVLAELRRLSGDRALID